MAESDSSPIPRIPIYTNHTQYYTKIDITGFENDSAFDSVLVPNSELPSARWHAAASSISNSFSENNPKGEMLGPAQL